MDFFQIYHKEAAIFLARVFLGFLFLFQAYDAMFNIRMKEVTSTYHSTYSRFGFPKILSALAAWYTSLSALIGGILLITGIFEYLGMYLLASNLLIAAIGFGLKEGLWDMRYVYPRLMLLLIIMIVPPGWDVWKLSYFF